MTNSIKESFPKAKNPKTKSITLTTDLILSALSIKNNPIEKAEIHLIENVNLENINYIDSAGLAYLAQLKILNPKLSFSGYSEKIVLLSRLYGLNFLFCNENECNANDSKGFQ